MRTLAILIAATALLSGCGYKLGSPAALPYKFIYVAPPAVETDLPELERALARSLRVAIATENSLRIAGKDVADGILELRVLSVDRDRAAAQFDDQGRGRKFTLMISAVASLRRTDAPDAFYFENLPIEISRDIFVDSGQTEAERQAGPAIADAIAQRTIERLVDAW